MSLKDLEIKSPTMAISDSQLISEKEPDDIGLADKYKGTTADKRDMITLGKKQVLRVC